MALMSTIQSITTWAIILGVAGTILFILGVELYKWWLKMKKDLEDTKNKLKGGNEQQWQDTHQQGQFQKWKQKKMNPQNQ